MRWEKTAHDALVITSGVIALDGEYGERVYLEAKRAKYDIGRTVRTANPITLNFLDSGLIIVQPPSHKIKPMIEECRIPLLSRVLILPEGISKHEAAAFYALPYIALTQMPAVEEILCNEEVRNGDDTLYLGKFDFQDYAETMTKISDEQRSVSETIAERLKSLASTLVPQPAG